ncbi:MAG: hypothetical protein JSR72_23625, partial [Proteobacteria bacterium]|nr:hypothetical protein [Pseudomonadota bacterium]
WTEPLGHVSAIKDVQGNVTKASYNELGQRKQSNDPDQGLWTFTYDAFGELVSQTDARNVTTTITGRDGLGRTTQRKQVSPASVTGLAPDTLLDTWTYDPANGKGLVDTVSRQRGTLSDPTTNPQTWKEQYTYDSASRPTTITTTINEAGTTLSLNSTTAYDPTYGRVDTQTYPSLPTGGAGLVVKHTYTGYGQLDALSNASTGYVYWVAQGQNAWGHVTGEQYPGVITGTHADYAATGQAQSLSWSGSASDNVSYTYDGFGNLATQYRSLSGGASNTESYKYDSLQRLTQATRSNGGTVNYGYTDNGNIKSKGDNGASNYTYAGAGSGCGPHAVTSANGLSYNCDANGNVIGGAITATYDADNHPTSISRNGGLMNWTYSTNGVMTTEVSSRGIRYFGPNGYEQIGTGTGATQVHELGPVIVSRTNGVDSVSVVLRDRLGSTINVIDNNTTTTRMYDAFGKVRKGDMTDSTDGKLNLSETIHGFTKHDHADDVQLIHMGGRVYDYQLGRFLQVDPVVGGTGSQALNPYSYIGNNPLSGTDPTGYQDNGCQVSEGHSCTANLHDSRSADPFSGRTTFTIDKAGTVRAYSSEGGVTVVTQSVGAHGEPAFTGSFRPANGARAGDGTKPVDQTGGAKNGASGIDGVEKDPGQAQLQKAAEFGKAFGNAGAEVINPCPGSTTAGGCAATVAATAAVGPVLGKVSGVAKSGFAKLEAEVLADLAAEKAAAQEGAKGWRVGDDVYKAIRGSEPSWSTVRSRFWKNEASAAGSAEKYGAENLERMRRGSAPQRYNDAKGGMESMELSHEPVPQRDGGKAFVPRWPQDHAAVDPYRKPGY